MECKLVSGVTPECLITHRFQLFDKLILAFLDDLSSSILKDPICRDFPSSASFAFWIRSSNLKRIAQSYPSSSFRLGLGLVLHIAPSNLPINTFFSWVLSLLAGNSNIIRVPSRNFPELDFWFNKLSCLFQYPDYKTIAESNSFVQYDKSSSATAHLSSLCEARVIWGGDQTITDIRTYPILPGAIDIAFPHRYSASIVYSDYYSSLNLTERSTIAESFAIDSFIFNQNACSSPHLVYFVGDNKSNHHSSCLFWDSLNSILASSRSDLALAKHNFDRLTHLFSVSQSPSVRSHRNLKHLTVCDLSDLSDLHSLTFRFGFFFQYFSSSLADFSSFATNHLQTITTSEYHLSSVRSFVVSHGLPGPRRIVPYGRALQFSTVWDGIDVVQLLSISFSE